MSKNSYNGPKLRGRHHDYIDAAAPLVRKAERDPSIVGIHVGMIVNHGGHRRITFRQEGNDRLVATVRSASSTQVITFYTTDRDRIQDTLEQAFR